MPSPIFSDDGRPESYTNPSHAPGGDGGGGQTNIMSDFRPVEIQAGGLGSTTQSPSTAQQLCLIDDDEGVSPRALGGGSGSGSGSGSHGGHYDDGDEEEDDDDMTGPGSLFQGPPVVDHQLLKRPGTLGFPDVKADKLLVPNNGNNSGGGGGSGDSHRDDLDPMTGSGVGGNINSSSSSSSSTGGGNLYQQGHSSSIKQEADVWNTPSPAAAPHTAIATTTAAEPQMKIEPSLVVSEYSGNNSPASTLPGHVIISNSNSNNNNNNNRHHYQNNNIDINKNQGAAPFNTVNTPLASNFSSPFLAPTTRSQPCVPIFNLVDYTTAQPLSPALSQQSHSSPTPSSAAAAHYLPQAPTSNGPYGFGFDHAGDDLSLSSPCSAGYTPISNTTGSSSCPVTPGGAFHHHHHPAASGGIGVAGLISAAGSQFIRDDGIWTSGPGSPLSSVFDSQSDSGYCASEPYGMGVNLGPAAAGSNAATTLGGTGASSLTTVSGNNSSGTSGSSPTQDEPYAKLIYRALMSREDKTMTLQEIYQWFRDNTAKTVGRGKGWQNSIRHNLSMNKGFCKNYRKPNSETEEPRDLTLYAVHCPDVKRATSWRLEPWAVENGIQSTTRYRKGTKRRGVAASSSASATAATANNDAFRPPRSSPYGYQQPQYDQPQGQHPYHVQQQQQQQQRRLGPGPHRVPPRSYRGGDPLRSMGRQAVINRSAADTPRSHMVAGPYYYHHGGHHHGQQQQQQLPEPGSPGPMAAEPGAASHPAHAHAHHHAGNSTSGGSGSGSGSSGGYVGYPVPGDMTTWAGYPPDDHHHSHPHHVASAGAGAGRAAHGRVAAPMDINYGYEDWDVHNVDF